MTKNGETLLLKSIPLVFAEDSTAESKQLPIEHVLDLAKALIQVPQEELKSAFFDDPKSVNDLSQLAMEQGAEIVALYKVFEAGVSQIFPTGFILTIFREVSQAHLYIRDNDVQPEHEALLTALRKSNELAIELFIKAGLNRSKYTYSLR